MSHEIYIGILEKLLFQPLSFFFFLTYTEQGTGGRGRRGGRAGARRRRSGSTGAGQGPHGPEGALSLAGEGPPWLGHERPQLLLRWPDVRAAPAVSDSA